jgi:hypothetical protein
MKPDEAAQVTAALKKLHKVTEPMAPNICYQALIFETALHAIAFGQSRAGFLGLVAAVYDNMTKMSRENAL